MMSMNMNMYVATIACAVLKRVSLELIKFCFFDLFCKVLAIPYMLMKKTPVINTCRHDLITISLIIWGGKKKFYLVKKTCVQSFINISYGAHVHVLLCRIIHQTFSISFPWAQLPHMHRIVLTLFKTVCLCVGGLI